MAGLRFFQKFGANHHRVHIKSAAGSYDVVCGSGILRRAVPEIADLGEFSSVHIISSRRVWRAAGKAIRKKIGPRGANKLHLFDDAEAKKDLRTVESLCRALARSGADRRSLLVAVGGGVVGDVVGFVGASYLRGVAVVQIPTTLVAQVDSAMGGKTGVNLPEGKNLIGAFYPPRLVLNDPEMLRTLSNREFRCATAEVIKYGVIADASLFAFLEEHMERVLDREKKALEYVISTCVQIKANVVSRDEKECGLREILNFGHTFAHALESVTRYRKFRHGEAVAWGMIAAALLGLEAGVTGAEEASRIIALTRRIGSLPAWPNASTKELIAFMRTDKKARGGKIRFVLATRIGKVQSFDGLPLELVERVLEAAPNAAGKRGPAVEPKRG
ncbi:MAG: 3-dehydroquinate synthase [Proteobacteria bacterium]|nr:MAG: 3-dehydroquinate synthase [Pseudomonadota bacterium]